MDLVDGGWRSNIFNYPPTGSPDGGARATAADLFNFLDAVRAGQLMTPELTQTYLTHPGHPRHVRVDGR